MIIENVNLFDNSINKVFVAIINSSSLLVTCNAN